MPKDKKRKRNHIDDPSTPSTPTTTNNDIDTSKPTALFTPTGGRSWTTSIALPGSIISNAKSHDQKTYLAGQIARALAVFSVDEIVIYNDGEEGAEAAVPVQNDSTYTAYSHPSHFLAHVLSYLETPAHLRKVLFAMHPNLKTAGTLPSLDMPHHLRDGEWCEYREGVVVYSNALGNHVDVGLGELRVVAGEEIPKNARVTVRLEQGSNTNTAVVVAPSEPREKVGYYWGYTLRQCGSLSAVITECPFDGGYDLSIGTSERGKPLADVMHAAGAGELPSWNHLLLVFGGVAGLETAAANDPELKKMGIDKGNVGDLFDLWVNVLPGQGSRTIRTEEAVWLGLMGTRGIIDNR